MSAIREDQKKSEQDFQRELWDFRKKYYNADKDPSFWDELIKAANDLHKACNASNDPYRREMILACVSDIERRSRKAEP